MFSVLTNNFTYDACCPTGTLYVVMGRLFHESQRTTYFWWKKPGWNNSRSNIKHISQVNSTELTEPNSVSTAAWMVIIRPLRHLCLVYLHVSVTQSPELWPVECDHLIYRYSVCTVELHKIDMCELWNPGVNLIKLLHV